MLILQVACYFFVVTLLNVATIVIVEVIVIINLVDVVAIAIVDFVVIELSMTNFEHNIMSRALR